MARVTPVAAAKELGVRPQIIYGFIKHHRVGTFPNPSGKADLVDFDEVKKLVGAVKPHRPKGSDGKPVRRLPGVLRGTVFTSHAYLKGNVRQRARPHVTEVVTDIVNDEEGNVSLIVTQTGENTHPMYWEAERLADRLKSGACKIEGTAALLGIVMFSWLAQGEIEAAAQLQMWCEVNGVDFEVIEESK